MEHSLCCRRSHRTLLQRCLTLQLLQTLSDRFPNTFQRIPPNYLTSQALPKKHANITPTYLPFQTLPKYLPNTPPNYLPFQQIPKQLFKIYPNICATNYLTLSPQPLQCSQKPFLALCNPPETPLDNIHVDDYTIEKDIHRRLHSDLTCV